VKVGGQVLIYVWALEQQKLKYKDQDVFVPWQLQKRYNQFAKKDNNQQQPQQQQEQQKEQTGTPDQGVAATAPSNVETNKGTGELVYKRYYHLFKQGELEALVRLIGDEYVRIEESLYEHENWCIVFTKLKEQQ